jgi:hypothetical protein
MPHVMAERGYSIVKGRTEVMGTGRLFTGRKYVEEQPWEVSSSNSGQAMRRLFVLLAIPLLTAVTPLDHATRKGGDGEGWRSSPSSGPYLSSSRAELVRVPLQASISPPTAASGSRASGSLRGPQTTGGPGTAGSTRSGSDSRRLGFSSG